MTQAQRNGLALMAILILALGLRMWGIAYDLPSIYNSDEAVNVNVVVRMYRMGDLNPRFYYYPSFFFYVNMGCYALCDLASPFFPQWPDRASMLAPRILAPGVARAEMPAVVLASRLLSVALGVASCLLVYLILRKFEEPRYVGLLAALFLAVSPTSVSQSHLALTDTLLAFMVLLTILLSAVIFLEGSVWAYLIGGLSVGLAISTKYNGVVLVVPLITAHILRTRTAFLRSYWIYLSGICILLGFLLGSPYWLVDTQEFLKTALYEANHYGVRGHAGMEGGTVAWYLNLLATDAGLLYAAAPVALVCALVHDRRKALLLASFPVVYLASIARLAVRNERTILPAMAPILILSALAFGYLIAWAGRTRAGILRAISVAAVALLCGAGVTMPLLASVRADAALQPDSRKTAQVWIEENIPHGSRIAYETYSPWIDPDLYDGLVLARLADHDAAWYSQEHFEYLVFGDWQFGRFFREPESYPDMVAKYRAIWDAFELVQAFDDGGYQVLIYRVK